MHLKIRSAYVADFLRRRYVAHKNYTLRLRSRNVAHTLTTPRKRSTNVTVPNSNYLLRNCCVWGVPTTYMLRFFLIHNVSFLSTTYWFYDFIFVWSIYAVPTTFLSLLPRCRHVHTTYKEYLLRCWSINHVSMA